MNILNITSNNRDVARGLANGNEVGAELGLAISGPVDVPSEAVLRAVQDILQGSKEHWPLPVQMPDIPLGPTQLNQNSQPNVHHETLPPAEQWKKNLRP